MKLYQLIVGLLCFSTLFFSCQKDSSLLIPKDSNISEFYSASSTHYSPMESFTDKEIAFFNLNQEPENLIFNSQKIAFSTIHSDILPEVFKRTYNKLIIDNSTHSFIDSWVDNYGIPFWYATKYESSYNDSIDLCYVPIVSKSSPKTNAFIVGYLNNATGEFAIDVRTRFEIIHTLEDPSFLNKDICINAGKFIEFDAHIFNVYIASDLQDVRNEYCSGNFVNVDVAENRCLDINVAFCWEIDCDSNSELHSIIFNGLPFAEYVSFNNWQSTFAQIYNPVSIYDNFTSSTMGGTLPTWGCLHCEENTDTDDLSEFFGDIGENLGDFFTDLWGFVSGIGNSILGFFQNLFGINQIKCPFGIAGDTETRGNGYEIVCQDYTAVVCEEGKDYYVIMDLLISDPYVVEDDPITYLGDCLVGKVFAFKYLQSIGSDMSIEEFMTDVLGCPENSINVESQDEFNDIAEEAFLEFLSNGFNIDEDQNYNMNQCEKELALKNPNCAIKIKNNKLLAQNTTISIFGFNKANECSDAFRHAYFNILNTIDCGAQLAKDFGDAHECEVPPEEQSSKEMDLHNNEIGRQIAINNPNSSNSQLISIVCTKLLNGDLFVLSDPADSNSAIVDSDIKNCSCP